jgi:hypothetical protein
LKKEAERRTYLNELDARKSLFVYISPRSEELRLHSRMDQNLKISNTCLNAVYSIMRLLLERFVVF